MSDIPTGDVRIVDDDPVIVEMIADALHMEGYLVRRVFNGEVLYFHRCRSRRAATSS